ncbi:MAG: hypothetical protein GC179_22020 [Anaerolineaceae bacterium]|nr:hypothetical protein [Anaerolineaceae bacterium]
MANPQNQSRLRTLTTAIVANETKITDSQLQQQHQQHFSPLLLLSPHDSLIVSNVVSSLTVGWRLIAGDYLPIGNLGGVSPFAKIAAALAEQSAENGSFLPIINPILPINVAACFSMSP